MEVFSDSGNSFGKVPLLCRYCLAERLMQVKIASPVCKPPSPGVMRYPARPEN
jgi:hypothetical protein